MATIMFNFDNIFKKDYLLIYYGIFLQLLFTIASNSNAIFSIASIFFLLPLVLLKKESVFLLAIFLIPAQRNIVMEVGGGTLVNLYFIYLFISCLFISKIAIKKDFILLLFCFIVIGIIGAIYNSRIIELLVYIKFFLTIFVIYVFTNKRDTYFYSRVIWYYILGTFFMILLSFMFDGFAFDQRFSSSEANDPNYIAVTIATSLAMLLVFQSINIIKNIVFVLMASFFIVGGLFTQSKSFLLMIAIISIFYMIRSIRFHFFKSLFIVIPVTLYIYIYLSRSYQNIPIINNIIQRTINPVGEDVSNGRIEIWSQYIDLLSIENNIFFGLGLNAYEEYNIGQVPHNFILENLSSFGFIGLISFYSIFVYLYYRFVGNVNGYIYGFLPIVVFLSGSLTLHSFLGLGGIISVVVCFLNIYLYKDISSNSFLSKKTNT